MGITCTARYLGLLSNNALWRANKGSWRPGDFNVGGSLGVPTKPPHPLDAWVTLLLAARPLARWQLQQWHLRLPVISKWLWLWSRLICPPSTHEGLNFLQTEHAIFIGVHCLEYSFVSSLKLLQRNRPVTVGVH
jgi:hypothetical protein